MGALIRVSDLDLPTGNTALLSRPEAMLHHLQGCQEEARFQENRLFYFSLFAKKELGALDFVVIIVFVFGDFCLFGTTA